MKLSSDFLLKLFAALFALAAVYHLIGVFTPINSSPAWRHFIFVVINSFCVYGLLKRPEYFTFFFLFLMTQQFYSHGKSIIDQWNEGRIDWISIVVLILMPMIFYHLLK